jgi:hypothetical protein
MYRAVRQTTPSRIILVRGCVEQATTKDDLTPIAKQSIQKLIFEFFVVKNTDKQTAQTPGINGVVLIF